MELIRSKKDIADIVGERGFLPFFEAAAPGFSIREMIDPRLWFTDVEGPWEWKGPLIREYGLIYGKFFCGKAAYLRRDVFLELMNYRRDGYDFDARFDDGLATFRERDLYLSVAENAPVLSKTLKEKAGYGPGGKKGFDTLITKLQMTCYVVISDFVYETAKNGKSFGWGIAEYTTPEALLGEDAVKNAYKTDPRESYEKLTAMMRLSVPNATEKQIKRFLN